MRVDRFCLRVLLAPLALCAARGAADEGEPRPPNLIFILADDLGYGDLGSYGQTKVRTPHLDRLAAGGTRFTQFYAGSTVCAPSRCSLLTGRHTGRATIRGNGDETRNHLLPEDVTVAEVLKRAGYVTGVFGKWGLGAPGTPGVPGKQGFDESFGHLLHRHAHRYYTDHLYRDGDRVAMDPVGDYTQDRVAAAALDFIRRHRGRPFFLFLPFAIPHAELLVPEDSLIEYRGRFPEKPFRNPAIDREPSRPGYRSQPTPRAAFAAMVSRLDRYVGELLGLLEELGLDGGTAVFFSSDNGPHREGGADPEFFRSAGSLRGIKRDLYEGGIRVPMLVRWPGRVPAGRVSDQVWAMWDFLPTAAALAGVGPPPEIDGVSLLPALLGGGRVDHPPLYWEFHERGFQQALRWGDWKAVKLGHGRPIELYDLGADVGEADDVAARHPDVVRRLERLLAGARADSPRWSARRARL